MFDHDPYEALSTLKPVGAFTVTSAEVRDGRPLEKAQWGAAAGGRDVSPSLSWSGFPPETQSFALTCLDPDAPTASGWWHWSVLDLPASVTSLDAGAGDLTSPNLRGGRMLPNESGDRCYSGPTPPAGTGVHRYFFVVHAVDVPKLDLPDDATPANLGFQLHFHTLARAVLVGTASADE
jgi:Raf kinase inhibitor-like YbhB/YbcL family protein